MMETVKAYIDLFVAMEEAMLKSTRELMHSIEQLKRKPHAQSPQFKPLVAINTKSLQRVKRVRLAKGRC